MQQTNAPEKIVLPFASGGGKNSIPTPSQIGITAGAASLTDGFPPLTRTPKSAGGVPPDGLDMNGVLYLVSGANRWHAAGAGYYYDSTFATDTNVGGYPIGARVLRTDGLGYWLNTTDNNVTDPESAGGAAAGWVPDFTNGVASITMTSANVTLTPLQYGKPIIVISGTLTANLNLIFPDIAAKWCVINNTTGAFTITCKTAAGTGVIINTSAIIVGDTINIYFANKDSSTGTVLSVFKNLSASATGTNATVTASADEIAVEDANNNYKTLRAVSLSINSASSGANGLDTGTLAASTWYSVWVIYNPATATIAGLLSASATAPTMPSGYTHKARIGWICTDGSANKYPLSFIQYGRRVQYKVAAGSNLVAMRLLASGTLGNITTPTWSAVAVGSFVPSTALSIDLTMQNTGSNTAMMAAPNNSYGSYSSTTNPPIMGNGTPSTGAGPIVKGSMILESTNIYVASNGSCQWFCNGWEDNI